MNLSVAQSIAMMALSLIIPASLAVARALWNRAHS